MDTHQRGSQFNQRSSLLNPPPKSDWLLSSFASCMGEIAAAALLQMNE